MLSRIIRARANVLLVLATRSDGGTSSAFEAVVREVAAERGVSQMRLHLEGLPLAHANAVLSQALSTSDEQALSVAELADASDGDPYVLTQIVNALADRPALGVASLAAQGVDDAMLCTLVAPHARRSRAAFLVVPSSANRSRSDLALELGHGAAGYTLVHQLVRARLMQRAGPRHHHDDYHSRLRNLIIEQVAQAEQQQTHLTLAQKLIARRARPGRIATHFMRAGDAAAAAPHAKLEGDRSSQELAFGRAARFYQMALDGHIR